MPILEKNENERNNNKKKDLFYFPFLSNFRSHISLIINIYM